MSRLIFFFINEEGIFFVARKEQETFDAFERSQKKYQVCCRSIVKTKGRVVSQETSLASYYFVCIMDYSSVLCIIQDEIGGSFVNWQFLQKNVN